MNLNFINLPAGVSASPPSLAVFADSSTHSFTLSTSATTQSGVFSISGAGGGKSHIVSQSLTTQPIANGTYTVSGQVRQPDGTGIGGTIFQVRDAVNALVTVPNCGGTNCPTDDNGNYSISLSGGTYTITASSPFGTFSPAAVSYTLAVSPGPSAQHRRLKTFNVSPEPDPPPAGSRAGVGIPIGTSISFQ
jgi:hypothetical protein